MAALLFGQHRLASISAWARNVNAPPPPLGGRWDEILAPVYRELRQNRQNLEVIERQEIGRATCRVSVCQSVSLLVVALAVNKKTMRRRARRRKHSTEILLR